MTELQNELASALIAGIVATINKKSVISAILNEVKAMNDEECSDALKELSDD